LRTPDLAQLILAGLPWQKELSPLPEYLALPAHEPRWLIPACDSHIGPALASWSPYRLSSRLKWGVFRMANRMGALRALANVESIALDNAEQIDWRAIGWKRAQPPLPLIYLGTRGSRRKAVVHLVNAENGNCEVIVKVPIGPGAKGAIVREAEVLTSLAAELYPFSPRLLHLDRQRGVATQQFIPGDSGSRRLRPEYLELLRSLVLQDEHTNICEQVASLRELGLSSLAPKLDVDLVESAFHVSCDAHLLPSCRVHGDFAPWNIRRRPLGAPALIDWEESHPTGLPLQDAYHFLHIQDFVFRKRPRAHFTDLLTFAKTLGIAPQQCRKLEITYLADAYVSCCLRAEHQRAEFLSRTLALVIRDRTRSAAITTMSPSRLRLVSSHHTNPARAELFDAMITQLNQAAIPYCVLSGFENTPQANASDVDIMFRPQDMPQIPSLLARTAHSAGAMLVQAIQHETTAYYFVLAKEHGKHLTHLDADCYSDYRRDARTWLLANDVIANRRKYRGFYVPSIVDEFTYYLIKKVLKRDIHSHHLNRLQQLFARNPAECRGRITQLWPPETAILLERAIVEVRLSWFEAQAVKLQNELRRSEAREKWACRSAHLLHEVGRLLRRMASPTGLSVMIVGGNSALRSELADSLICDLEPAFRRTRRIWSTANVPRRFAQTIGMWAARIRSTLVVRTSDPDANLPALQQSLHRFVAACLQALTPCDFVIDLGSDQRRDLARIQVPRLGTLVLDAGEPFEQILAKARKAILHLLAARAESRLGLRTADREPATDTQAKLAGFRSQGLD
jgi:hypothetical protein